MLIRGRKIVDMGVRGGWEKLEKVEGGKTLIKMYYVSKEKQCSVKGK